VPGGVLDPAVPVLRCQRPDGTVAAILVNYACHPVTLGPDNLLATADYPGYVVRTLEAIYPGVLALFATGCCGQINTGHTARDGTFGRGLAWRTYGEAERLGRAVAGAAAQAAEQSAREAAVLPAAPQAIATAPVRVARRTVAMPLLPVAAPEEIAALTAKWEAERERLVREGGTAGEIGQFTVWLAWADAFQMGRLPATVEAELQVIMLGEVALVLLPGEMFVEFGLAIKARAAPRPVLTLAYANGTPGYIPHRSAYPEGGYEVEEAYRYYGYPACFAPEAGEALVEAARELLGSQV
jgi:neutral ceramidase